MYQTGKELVYSNFLERNVIGLLVKNLLESFIVVYVLTCAGASHFCLLAFGSRNLRIEILIILSNLEKMQKNND